MAPAVRSPPLDRGRLALTGTRKPVIVLRMPEAVHSAVVALAIVFAVFGVYYRIRSLRPGERLDRTKEGWPVLIGIRLVGLLTMGITVRCLWRPSSFAWASVPVPNAARWLGVIAMAFTVAWLIWMFHSLGRNLTDTVVTRRDAHFVNQGPYHFVRNPMYTGVLMLGAALGLALGTWLIPLATIAVFSLFVLRTRTEERYLLERFGDQYRNYMDRVGRFFPKLR
jgi:protein-S-isoprenylcysteine O-methyltransferase Ste14